MHTSAIVTAVALNTRRRLSRSCEIRLLTLDTRDCGAHGYAGICIALS
jgi:hypothetical protein